MHIDSEFLSMKAICITMNACWVGGSYCSLEPFQGSCCAKRRGPQKPGFKRKLNARGSVSTLLAVGEGVKGTFHCVRRQDDSRPAHQVVPLKKMCPSWWILEKII